MSYRDKLYSAYVSTHTSNLYGHASIEDIIKQFPVWGKYFQRFFPKSKNANILDIGCGDGGFVHFLHESGYARAEGVDVSQEQVKLSRHLNIRGITHSSIFGYLEGKQDVYDVIFARDVIEHFNKEEVLDIFSCVHRALKPGGLFVIQVPNGESPMVGRIRYGDFSHELSFTQSSLNQVFSLTGYSKINCYSTGPVAKGYRSILRVWIWKAIEALVRFYVMIETGSSSGIYTQNIIAAGVK